ncbi:MAG TPA: 50S ribosomal protein L11 methyltransferase [Chloroflexi bacterium]|nr:50S ribosomal protein L11 methyltransferase [Chloroflexota bacterium]
MYWLEISVTTDGEAAEALSEVLRPYAYDQGVVIEQLGDAHSLDPTALEPEVTVKIFVPEDEDSPDLRRKLMEALYHMNRLYPVGEPRFRELQEEDWANAWRVNYHPFRVGRRLWIQPSWEEIDDLTAEDVVITLDPGMAFGTGLHPSTQMCLKALEDYIRPGYDVLDVGTGSGILSIAAAKLGAAKIVAFDNDRQAVRSARMNAIQNAVDRKMFLYQGEITALGSSSWNLVMVNILAPVIISLLKENGILHHLKRDGQAILSGIIEEQVGDVRRAVKDAGGSVIDDLKVRDWVCLVVEKEKTP